MLTTHCFRVAGRNPTISMASCRRSKSCFRSSPSTVKQSCWFQEATSHRPLNSLPQCEVSPKVQLRVAPPFHYTLLHSNSSMHNMYAAFVCPAGPPTPTHKVFPSKCFYKCSEIYICCQVHKCECFHPLWLPEYY